MRSEVSCANTLEKASFVNSPAPPFPFNNSKDIDSSETSEDSENPEPCERFDKLVKFGLWIPCLLLPERCLNRATPQSYWQRSQEMRPQCL